MQCSSVPTVRMSVEVEFNNQTTLTREAVHLALEVPGLAKKANKPTPALTGEVTLPAVPPAKAYTFTTGF